MCPACGEPMVGFQLHGVEIDRCLKCGGTWLDSGELETLLRLTDTPTGELSAALAAAASGGRRGRRHCPRCPRRLREVDIGRAGGGITQLDRCVQGHGLWFDQGEMGEVIRSFNGGEKGEVSRFFADLYHEAVRDIPGGE